jgi:16S rRNA (guanine966-N2)-methyltransferase
MRVAAGSLKGRELRYPKAGLRPTKNMTRQAIFNILGDRVVGARVLDLFAGGGSLGIEALSRGAVSVVFVEQSGATFAFLKRNIAGLGTATALRLDVLKAVERFAPNSFDVVLADPPYRLGLVGATVQRVAGSGVISAGGLLMIEHHRDEPAPVPDGWELLRQGKYGETRVALIRRNS